MTPAQFTAARALAKAYNHLWSSVDDGTYNLDEIERIASEWQHPMLPAGIECPSYEVDADGSLVITHITSSGRLHWQVHPSGNVVLEVYRPSDLSPARAQLARTMAYAAISNIQPSDDAGICVARIWLINDDSEMIAFTDDYELSTSDRDEAEYEHFAYDDSLHDNLLFERHVKALIRPIVALLTANAPERTEDEDYDTWKAKYIRPAIEQAKDWLAPLFEKALPDPYDGDVDASPETFWQVAKDNYDNTTCLYVIHKGEEFPVESEKTAVHTVLLLRQRPEMNLIDALRIGIESREYLPRREEVK